MPQTTPGDTPPQKTPPRQFRILTFDGGPSGLRYLYNLQEIIKIAPTFLSSVDLFVGNSNGAFLALYLASRTADELKYGPKIIKELIELDVEFVKKMQPGGWMNWMVQGARFLSGCKPLLLLDGLYEFMQRPDVFGHKRLNDLKQKVAIVTFRLFSFVRDKENPMARRWGPHIYHNLLPDPSDPNYTKEFDRIYFGSNNPEFRELSLAELVLRSGSMPMLTPIHGGFIDGSVFANNPEVVAVAQVLEARMWLNYRYNRDNDGNFSPKGWIRGVQDLLLFSLGGDDRWFSTKRVEEEIQRAHQSPSNSAKHLLQWGWGNWMIRPTSPMLLLKLMLTSDARGNSQQTSKLMQAITSFRLSSQSEKGILSDMFKVVLGSGIKELLRDAQSDADRWVKASPPVITFIAEVYKRSGVLEQYKPEASTTNPSEEELASEDLSLLDQVTCSALQELGYSEVESLELTSWLCEARHHLGILASFVIDEEHNLAMSVTERIRIVFDDAEPLTLIARDIIGTFLSLLSKQQTPEEFNRTYLLTMLWLLLVWSMTPEHHEKQRPLLTLLGEPFYLIPLLQHFHELEDFDIPEDSTFL